MLLTSWQTNFTAGEISAFLYARTDLKQWGNSARSIRNFIVRPQGGLFKRQGTMYVAEVKDSSKNTRLIPFEYSTEQAYVLELGEGYIRFYKDGGQILSTAAITNGTFTTDLTGWTDDDTGTGTSSQTAGVMRLNGGAAGVAARTQAVSKVGTAQYTLTFTVATNTCTYKIGTTSGGTEIATGTGSVGANSVNFTPTNEGTIYIQFSNSANNNSDVDTVVLSTPVYQISSPYQAADIDAVSFAQSFDTLFLCHASYKPVLVERTGHSEWSSNSYILEDGPFFDEVDEVYGGIGTGRTMTPSGTTGSVTFTASADTFVSTDVDRIIRFRSTSTAAWGWGKITAYTSATQVTVSITSGLDVAAASQFWRLGTFSDTTGWPAHVTIYDQRLVFAKTTYQQQSVWFSTASDIFNFRPDNSALKDEVDATTAMSYTIYSNTANVIKWVAISKYLFVGTSGGIYIVRSSSQQEAITPTNIQITQAVNESCSDYPPVQTTNNLLVIERAGRKLMEVLYSFSEDAYKALDAAILSESRTKGKVKWLTRQAEPNYLIWGCTEDGKLFNITYIKDQSVTAWTEQVIGGTDVAVKSLATIPGSVEDDVYMIVSRTINGSTKQYIEYLSQTYLDQDVTESMYLDCAAEYSGAATTTITGLSHLEGQTVSCFSEAGYRVGVSAAVSGGSITLDTSVTAAWVGLPYTSSVTLNQPHLDVSSGSIAGKTGRIHKAVLRLYNSYGGEIGISSSVVDVMPEYGSSTIMNGAVVLKTGDFEFSVPSDFTLTPLLYVEHDLPVPFNLLGVMLKMSYSQK